MDAQEKERVMEQCTRFLAWHYRQKPEEVLRELAETTGAEWKSDVYGQGSLINDFEHEIAALLGKEQAVFMPSGTMAQQIALRIWADRKKIPNVAFHPLCHLEIHEQKGYQILHGLHGVLVGRSDRLMTSQDLQAVREPLAALLLELPQREIGGKLPSWEELNAITEWAHERNIATHMDGARLWESQPFYQRPHAEISGLFHTVYVSFYKGLGGLAGAVLAGPGDYIAEARIWQRRHGGNLIRMYPYVLSARLGLEKHLGRMAEYHAKALELAAVLDSFPQIEVTPNPPHTNMMHIFVRGDKERLETAAVELARESGTWLFGDLNTCTVPNYFKLEISVGDATLDLTKEEIGALFRQLFERAEAPL